MEEGTLVLDGFATADGFTKIVAHHVHFCGLYPAAAQKVTSFHLQPTGGLKGHATLHLAVPSRATAVCVTLVCRYGMGWLRHGRCRFTKADNGES